MALSKSISTGSMVTGCLLLVLTLISIICGSVVVSKVKSPEGLVGIGFWGLYFAVPGVLSIAAGVKKQSSLLAAALGTNILGIILAIVGLLTGAIFWSQLSSCIRRSCPYDDVKFSDLETVRNGNAAVTITFVCFAVVTFVGSIYGCLGSSCSQRPTMIVTTAQPGTMVMATPSYPAYNQQPPSYSQGQVFVDTKAQH